MHFNHGRTLIKVIHYLPNDKTITNNQWLHSIVCSKIVRIMRYVGKDFVWVKRKTLIVI